MANGEQAGSGRMTVDTPRSSRAAAAAMLVVTVAGGLLRVLAPTRTALWRDEAQYVAIAAMASARDIMAFLYAHESHPPLYYLVGHLAGQTGLQIDEAMSWLSLIASIGVVPLIYRVGRVALGNLAGAAAAFCTAFSIPLVLWSVEVRPYAVLAILFVVSSHSLGRLLTTRRPRWAAAWILATALALNVHHFAVVFCGAQLVIGIGLLIRMRVPRDLLKLVGGASATICLLWLPSAVFMEHQLKHASYPAMRPFTWDGPPRLLARYALDFPLEILLPLVAGGAIVAMRWRGYTQRALDGEAERLAMLMIAPTTLCLAMLGQYRSNLLTPHLMFALVPLAMLPVGAVVAMCLTSRRRVMGVIAVQVVVAAATLSAVQLEGYVETTVDLVARTIEAESLPEDTIIIVPGFAAVSFNQYFGGNNRQISYPERRRVERYRFDGEFERVASVWALRSFQVLMDSIAESGGRVWLVTDARWVRAKREAPVELSIEEFGGLAQAERSRSKRVFAEVASRFGPARLAFGEEEHGPARELLAAWLFAPADSTTR